jgi:hypothetical protein
VDGGMLWRNGCDGKVLRCGAGDTHQQAPPPPPPPLGSRERNKEPQGTPPPFALNKKPGPARGPSRAL